MSSFLLFTFFQVALSVLHFLSFCISELSTLPRHLRFGMSICVLIHHKLSLFPQDNGAVLSARCGPAGSWMCEIICTCPHAPCFLPLVQTSSIQRRFSRNINHSTAAGRVKGTLSAWAEPLQSCLASGAGILASWKL